MPESSQYNGPDSHLAAGDSGNRFEEGLCGDRADCFWEDVDLFAPHYFGFAEASGLLSLYCIMPHEGACVLDKRAVLIIINGFRLVFEHLCGRL